jgi:hypothetical protein
MGNQLVNTVLEATGLSRDDIENEFIALLNKFEKSPETLTLEELREVMAEYLQTVFLELVTENKKGDSI